MRIVGVDPGSISGIALIANEEVVSEREQESLKGLYDALIYYHPDILVVERFIFSFRFRSRNAEAPLKSIGICELYQQIYDCQLVYSNPALLQGKVKPKGISPHIWAARVHALAYLEKNK